MHEAAILAGWGFAAVSVVGALYALAAALLARRFFRSRQTPAASLPAVTLLKPLHGAEPGLRDHLEGFCTQRYPAPVQVIFGVQDPFDPAANVRSLQRQYPAIDIELVIDDRTYGLNRKVSNLVNMERRIRHSIVVIADSDIGVGDTYLARVVTALGPAEVGFVTCPYVGKPTGNGWSALSAMGVNYHFLPSVVVGTALKLATPCFGATVAFRTAALEGIGGFLPLANRLADDHEIGRAIRATGRDFVLLPLAVTHACPERSLRQLVRHELRWARTIRTIDPAGFAGSGVCHALPAALIAVCLLGFSAPAAMILALALGSRLYLRRVIDRATGSTAGAWWMTPARDLLSFAIFVSAFLINSVSWGGARLRVDAKGALTSH